MMPEEYKSLHKKIKATKRDREKYIDKFIHPINLELQKFNINAQIKGRAKHYFSILGKMRKQNLLFEDL